MENKYFFSVISSKAKASWYPGLRVLVSLYVCAGDFIITIFQKLEMDLVILLTRLLVGQLVFIRREVLGFSGVLHQVAQEVTSSDS